MKALPCLTSSHMYPTVLFLNLLLPSPPNFLPELNFAAQLPRSFAVRDLRALRTEYFSPFCKVIIWSRRRDLSFGVACLPVVINLTALKEQAATTCCMKFQIN